MTEKMIDFSYVHDRYIRNPDGSLSRMDEPWYEAEQIAPETWRIFSSGDFSYLVEGEKEAIAIDTGYGAGNIRAYMQSLTKQPLRDVVNTHDHFDHTANNGYFERAFMGKKSIPLATIPFPSFAGIRFPQDYERVAVGAGYVFSLGGRELEVFELPDHAVGSIVLLDRRERLLFSGDEFTVGGKRLNGGVASYYKYLKKIMEHRNAFDRLCGGSGILDASLADALFSCAVRILDGEEGEKPEKREVHLPLPKSPDGQGRIVYDRQLPHPEDLPCDGEDAAEAYRREVRCGDIWLNYDIRLRDC